MRSCAVGGRSSHVFSTEIVGAEIARLQPLQIPARVADLLVVGGTSQQLIFDFSAIGIEKMRPLSRWARPKTMNSNRVAIPTLVRIKTGALGRMGIYLSRQGHRRVAVFQSAGLLDDICGQIRFGLLSESIEPIVWVNIAANEFERAISHFTDLPPSVTAIIGLGGGKALDVAKYVAFLGKLPYFAVPTSLSNDGFASPQSSLTVCGKRKSLAAAMPFAVVVDTAAWRGAPQPFSFSGVGALGAQFTALGDVEPAVR